AKIIAVADTWDAITSHRPYRPARGVDVALEELRKYSGILFEPEIVNACIKLYDEKKIDFYS
ncbi:MAG: hypothetical protein PSV35_07295, partial [bacterium]|nr:hypothetical protein [bacterium]